MTVWIVSKNGWSTLGPNYWSLVPSSSLEVCDLIDGHVWRWIGKRQLLKQAVSV
ncbi:uncharacterized protein M421DRAFT_108846 [Didymella exigua CBS 183.55]|uniref:Uncharacterized protein n=1 Tax=Didymella exigua CBS 183.55 TaxID=1150837 RepID=A0A6A5S8Z3_9PLEO|nr:uncharacterized protein M421DRAFT_108846 [Didymella exigua CBS 183.55]KAF1933947.1 hypothetical protein M421DRAFT_108846 [Didymella exigua CBS 183.55]